MKKRAARAEQDLLNEIVRRIVAVASPDRIILFGSAARGGVEKPRDLDILVIKSGVEHRRRMAQRIHLSLGGLNIPIDVVVVTPEDVRDLGNKEGTILKPALQEGVELYAA